MFEYASTCSLLIPYCKNYGCAISILPWSWNTKAMMGMSEGVFAKLGSWLKSSDSSVFFFPNLEFYSVLSMDVPLSMW